MSTRYKSFIPLINEVKAQCREIQQLKSAINNVDDKVEKVIRFIKEHTSEDDKKKK